MLLLCATLILFGSTSCIVPLRVRVPDVAFPA